MLRTNPTQMRPNPNNYQSQPGTESNEIDWRNRPSQQQIEPVQYEFERFPDEVNKELLANLRNYYNRKNERNKNRK